MEREGNLSYLYKMSIALVATVYVCFHSSVAFGQEITIPAPRSKYDISHDYHVKLLELAFANTPTKYSLNNSKLPLNQGRSQVELEKGRQLDLYWLGADIELDSNLVQVPVPTTRGLIGFRKFFIRKDMEQAFSKVQSLEHLQQFVACQGQHWPDTKVLEHAKLPVTSSQNYETLFKMLEVGRCDYFPRGIHDFLTELEVRRNRYQGLAQHASIQLYYPFAVYFYTSKQQSELAQQLTTSLEKLAKNGELLNFMKSHPLTEQVFVSSKSKSEKIFQLPNPLMQSNPRVSDPDFWFQPEHFLKSKSEK